jgi:hypothetical protein
MCPLSHFRNPQSAIMKNASLRSDTFLIVTLPLWSTAADSSGSFTNFFRMITTPEASELIA